jgi:hypothetical protein
MEAQGKLKIYDNISKNEYYAHLNNTRVLFNCALQDWVSNTVSEADTLGANVLYPAYRSFPETFADDPNRLYVPWSLDDAYHKMQDLLQEPHHNMGLISDWTDGTIDRVIDIMQGQGEKWNRAGNRYRDQVSRAKYPVVKIEQLAYQDQVHVVHGHFGEIMSFQNQIRAIPDKKFIILSPDTPEDSAMLNKRRLAVGQTQLVDGDYFDGEQVFLYEPFMYHWYFQTPMDNIMNVSISDWFTQDIDSVLDKLSYFLRCTVDKDKINSIHKDWIEANNL